MQMRFGGTTLCTAPSTTTAIALQLRPDATPASHIEPPAMLLHHWQEGTGLITHVIPIGTFPGPYPFACAGRLAFTFRSFAALPPRIACLSAAVSFAPDTNAIGSYMPMSKG